MKQVLHAVFNVGLLGSWLLLATATVAQDISLAEIRESVDADLQQSLQDLAALREQITEEKIPLVTELNETENEIRALRDNAARLQGIRDSRELGLGDLQARLQAWENENTYLINLVNEYAAQFQGILHVSESSRYEEVVAAYNITRNSPDRDASLAAQLALVDQGLVRIRSSLGGEQYAGNSVTADGTLIPGEFFRFGPFVLFLDQQREFSGIVTAEDGINARTFGLNARADDLATLATGAAVTLPVDVTEGRVTAISSNQQGLLDHIGNGGIWIFPILFFALLSLLIALYKAIQIYRVKLPDMVTVRQILEKSRTADQAGAAQLASQIPAPVGPMLEQGIAYARQSKELLQEVLYESILETRPRLNRLLPVIATTAAVAPLLGLLGTVTGMINTFNLITLFGTGDARVLSSGISEALVTTEFGLVVAIPALIVHAILNRRIRTIIADMEKYALIFSNGLSLQSAPTDQQTQARV